jgi:Tfp pilus assembly protein PilN
MFGLNTYFTIGFAVILAMMGLYFVYSQHEIKNLEQTIATQQIALQDQTLVIAQLQKDAADIKKYNQTIDQIIQDQNVQAQTLQNKLNSLVGTPEEKAATLEKMINNAATLRVRCIALATGAIAKGGEVNKLCPQLLPKKISKLKKVVKKK